MLLIGQVGTAISCVLMALSANAYQFLAFSVLLLIFKSSYLLLYTIMIQAAGQEKKNVTGVYHAVIQTAIIAATVMSGWVIGLANPLQVFWWIALLDFLQAAVCFFVLRRVAIIDNSIPAEADTMLKNRVDIRFLAKMALLIFTLHYAVNIIRPFFTVFTEETYHTTIIGSSLLFLIPSLMAVAALPVMKKCSSQRILSLYKMSGLLLLISLVLQGVASNLWVLILARCLFGFTLAVCQASLDMYLFERSRNVHSDYSVLSSFQNIGLLLAPLSALALVEDYSIVSPFIAAGVIFVVHLFVVTITSYRKRTVHKI